MAAPLAAPLIIGGLKLGGKALGTLLAGGAITAGIGRGVHEISDSTLTKPDPTSKLPSGFGTGLDNILGADEQDRAQIGTFDRTTGQWKRKWNSGINDWILGHNTDALRAERQRLDNARIKSQYSAKLSALEAALPQKLKSSVPVLGDQESRETYDGRVKAFGEQVAAYELAKGQNAFGGKELSALPSVAQSQAAINMHEQTRPGGVEQTRLRQEWQVNKQNAQANKIAALSLANQLVMNQRSNQLQLQLADMQYQDRRLERSYRQKRDDRKDKLAMMTALMGGLSNSARMLY